MIQKDRTIPIHESVSIKIKEYILFLNDHKIYPDENDALFYTTNQKPFSLSKIQYTFKLIRCGITHEDSDHTNVRLYDFRHSFASRTIYQWLITKKMLMRNYTYCHVILVIQNLKTRIGIYHHQYY